MANRVDSKMVELGLAQSRERARALIIEGVVLLDGVRVMKPSDTIRDGQIHFTERESDSVCQPRRVEIAESYRYLSNFA